MANTTRRGFVAGLLSLPFVSKLLGREEPQADNHAEHLKAHLDMLYERGEPNVLYFYDSKTGKRTPVSPE